MNTKQLAFFLLLIYPWILLSAQNKVTVKDFMTNQPLSGAGILLKKTSRQLQTGDDRMFDLQKLHPITEKDTLIVSSVGYGQEIIPISALKGMEYTVYLKMKVEVLGQAVVEGREPELLSSIPFTELSHMPGWVSEFGAAIVGEKIYVVGGNISINEVIAPNAAPISGTKPAFQWIAYNDKMYVYDIPTDTWTTSRYLFSKRANHNVINNNGKIYILGGKRNSKNKKLEYLDDKIEVYDSVKDTLIVDRSNPHQAVNSLSVVYDNNIIVLGGSTKLYNGGNQVYTSKGHMLNLSTGYWYELPELPKEKASELNGTVVGGTIYLIGGYRGYALHDICTYDLSSGEYKLIAKLPEAMKRPAIAYNNKSTIYIYNDQVLYCLDVKSNMMKAYYLLTDLVNPEMFYKEGELYILGGKRFGDPSDKLYKVDTSELRKVREYVLYNR
uniref:Kelch repeat-containing protein n=1 Tax=uncultured Dysgonomonas sp. TaxID=206096 RepID=UPI00258D03B8|nr:hypothetical protein [uncultured Dysgonomonas sp.]